MLKRYLRSRYNMSPDDYRRRWSLPADTTRWSPADGMLGSEEACVIVAPRMHPVALS